SGVVNTGVAYALSFDAMDVLDAQTVAILSYIDPVTALVLSALILGERMGPLGMVGAALILGAAVVSRLPPREART
ncbi:MAG: DMT family transporter, partial [Synergistaceae bacterium]|nr:DMT family transporter [Synergistaceae bacterium]